MARAANLIRKQVMLSAANIEKLELIANKGQSSVAEVVRNAIDHFDPDSAASESSEMLELTSKKLKEAISDTQRTRRRLNRTLKKIEAGSR